MILRRYRCGSPLWKGKGGLCDPTASPIWSHCPKSPSSAAVLLSHQPRRQSRAGSIPASAGCGLQPGREARCSGGCWSGCGLWGCSQGRRPGVAGLDAGCGLRAAGCGQGAGLGSGRASRPGLAPSCVSRFVLNDVKQSWSWRLGLITFNYNNCCLSPVFCISPWGNLSAASFPALLQLPPIDRIALAPLL